MTQAENPLQWRSLLLRLMVTGIVLALWFWSQSLIGCRTAPASGIGDAVHNLIWHYPGFPSLLVTYRVANDFFFSGHTAIAVFGALELARYHRKWLTFAAVLVVFFEVATVLILRAHYTFDVFTGIIAALWVAHVSERLSPLLDRLLGA